MHNLKYREHEIVISFNRQAFKWQASGDLNALLDAETDDQALIEVKAMINLKLNGLNPSLQAFVDSL